MNVGDNVPCMFIKLKYGKQGDIMTKHNKIINYIKGLVPGAKISVRGVSTKLNVSEGTAYRAIKEAEVQGYVNTIPRVGTIRVENRNKKDIISAAKKADIHSYISELPHGYDTFISREVGSGIQLSGGQWQKLAIARAFFRDAKLLILDEPTSAVDSIAEEMIFENLRENAEHKTTFIVSHRFATVRKAERILVVEDGKILEEGNHSELMKRDGLYRNMYNKQVGKH